MIKPIPGFEHYFADELGNIYSNKQVNGKSKEPGEMHSLAKVLHGKNNYRYNHVQLRNNGKNCKITIAPLVLSAFVSPRPDGMLACHGINGQFDDSLENLSWGTPHKNFCLDKFRDGTVLYGEKSPASKLNELQVRIIKRFISYGIYGSKRYLSKVFHVSEGAIHAIAYKISWVRIKCL